MIFTTNKHVVIKGNTTENIIQLKRIIYSFAKHLERNGVNHNNIREVLKSPMRMALMEFDGLNEIEALKKETIRLNKLCGKDCKDEI